MSWEDRLREAAYTSPSGNRMLFDYEDVSRSSRKKTTTFTFPDADGAFVQDTGRGERRYPLRCIFWGSDYDLEASAFEAMLEERGPGVLEHPVYGQVDVVPTGDIGRRDDLVTAANQAIVEVEFYETQQLQFPSNQSQPADEVAAAIEEYNQAAAEDFARVVEVDDTAGQAELAGTYERTLDRASDGLSAVAQTQDDVREAFDDIETSIRRGIDTLVQEPLSLAFQTSQMIQAPARAATSVTERLSSYRDLAESIVNGRGANTSNQLASDDLYASSAVSGQVLSCINHEFDRRRDVFDAADELLDLFDSVQAWREQQYPETGNVDTGASYQALQESVAIVAGFLVEISFDLATERSIVVTSPRTIVDLCAELYGEVDSRLDFLIETNGLTGDEIIEIPVGRRIVYYA